MFYAHHAPHHHIQARRFVHALLPFVILATALLFFGWATHTAQAAPTAELTVNSTADLIADDGQCTLREAITAANTDTASGAMVGECDAGSGDDIINLPAGEYKLLLFGDEDNNVTGDFDISSNMHIRSQNGDKVVLHGNFVDRLFEISANTVVTIEAVTIQYGQATTGGGIRNLGNLTLRDSAVLSNTATSGVGGGLVTGGGAGPIATIINSTFVNNMAGGVGDAIYAGNSSGTLHLLQSTVSGNGDRAVSLNAATVTIENSILANSTGAGRDCQISNGASVSISNTVVESANCQAGYVANVQTGDPALGALDNNGGPTPTVALLSNSPAIDAGNSATCEATDQRGELRSNDHNCDIGAFELQFEDSPTVIVDALVLNEPQSFGPTLITLTLKGGTDPGTITITRKLQHPIHHPSDPVGNGEMKLSWFISADVEAGLNIEATFCYTNANLATLKGRERDLKIWWKEAGDGFIPASPQDPVDRAANCITATEVQHFSQWTLAAQRPSLVEMSGISAETNQVPLLLAAFTTLLVTTGVARRRQQ